MGGGIQAEMRRGGREKPQRQQRRRWEVNRKIMSTCRTFQYGAQKSSGVVPRKRQLWRGKRSLYVDNDASSASIDGEGPGAWWGGHQVALTASHGSVVFAKAANHHRKECTWVRRGQAGGAEDRGNTTSPDASGMMG